MKSKLCALLVALALVVSPVFSANRITTWTSGQVLTSGNLNSEFDNITVSGTILRTGGAWNSTDDIGVGFGAADPDARIEWETTQTVDALVIGLGTGRILQIMELGDMATDWGLGSQTNPALYIHSADAGTTTDYVKITHDQTNGIIDVGGTTVITMAITTGDVTIAGDLVVSGAGPHAMGGPTGNNNRMRLQGSYTSGGVSNTATMLRVDGVLTGAGGDTQFQGVADFSGGVTTGGASETITIIAQLKLDEPTLVIGSGDTVTTSATLYISGAATEATNDHSLLIAAGDVRIGAVGTNDGHVHILSPATGTAALVVEMPSSASVNAQAWHYGGESRVNLALTATTTVIDLESRDLGDDNAGPVARVGRNTNVTNSNTGTIRFTDDGGTAQFIWVDNSASPGDVRIHTAAPASATTDLAGTIVGTQASPRYIKNILHEWTDEEAFKVLDQVLVTPIYDFVYKSGKYNRVFTGIAIEDGEEPWYGMDRAGTDDYVPEGTAKALNEVNVAGYMILSVRALNLKIEELNNEISFLRSHHIVVAR